MKNFSFSHVVILLIAFSKLSASGVVIANAYEGIYFMQISSIVEVTVNNQIAIVKTTQTFRNNSGGDIAVKYGFPMHESASAVKLRWNTYEGWFTASISGDSQDTLQGNNGNGQPIDPYLEQYLGEFPLLFSPDGVILKDSIITVELTYVELLPYKFSVVNYNYPNNYGMISNDIISGEQSFSLNLTSSRTVVNFNLTSHQGQTIQNTYDAEVYYSVFEQEPQGDFNLEFELSSSDLGLFDISTFQSDIVNECDNFGDGYVTLIIEPQSDSNAVVLDKNFILVVDKSGSMGGTKMQQARDAASFVVDHLNMDDHFNVVYFDDNVQSINPGLVPYNNTTSNYALNEISQLDAGGGTNISDALITAIGQFTATDPGAANIIIFFTDGEATAGITNTPGILQAVQDAVNFAETEIFLYTFGIGDYVNEQLLTLLAQQNSGASVFLGSDEVELVITDYFLQVNNPVLLNTEISFDPPIITDIYPNPLPNLYKGQQLILSGRYIEPVPVTVTLSGTAYNEPVMYQYSFTPVDTPVFEHQFLPKIWAKALIDQLTISFYSTIDVNIQEQLQNQIDSASICYGVVSSFTSFEDNGGGGSTANEQPEVTATSISAFPNPFWHITTVILQTDIPFGEVDLFITDANGLIIRKIQGATDSYGLVRLTWDGKNDSGAIVPDGMYYVYTVINGMRHYLKIVKTG